MICELNEDFNDFIYTKNKEYLESNNGQKDDNETILNDNPQKFLKNDPLFGPAAPQLNEDTPLESNENVASRAFGNGVQLAYDQYQQLPVILPGFSTGFFYFTILNEFRNFKFCYISIQ